MSKSKVQKIILSQIPSEAKSNKTVHAFAINDEKTINVEIKKLLTIDETYSMVASVVNGIFDSDGYQPCLKKLVISKAIVLYYTNITDDIGNEDLIDLVYNTDIIDVIISKIHAKQFNDIQDSIHEAINYRVQETSAAQTKKLNNIIADIDTYIKMMETVTSQYSDVNIKDLVDSVKSISKIPENDLVNNILAYRDREQTATELTPQDVPIN